MTFKQLCKIEPKLKNLEKDIRDHTKRAKAVLREEKANGVYCANRHWYGYDCLYGYKHRMHRLVGWEAKRNGEAGLITTSEAYSTAYHYLYDLLPACEHEDRMCASYHNDAGVS